MQTPTKITIEPSGPTGILLIVEYANGSNIRSVHIVRDSVSAGLEIKHLKNGIFNRLDAMIANGG